MTNASVYIGDINDPAFDINAQGPFGNIPRALCKSFPPSREAHNLLFHGWVKDRQILWMQTDATGFVAPVTKAQLLDYVDYVYGSDDSYTDPAHMLCWEGKPYLVDWLIEIQVFISTLEETKLYALVAETD